jgi:hypothetical protein
MSPLGVHTQKCVGHAKRAASWRLAYQETAPNRSLNSGAATRAKPCKSSAYTRSAPAFAAHFMSEQVVNLGAAQAAPGRFRRRLELLGGREGKPPKNNPGRSRQRVIPVLG